MKQLVLIGGGHAHIEVLRALAEQPVEGWQVTLGSPYPQLLYSGMVPGVVAGHYALDDCAIDLVALTQRAGATFRRQAASLIDPARREVVFADGASARYDLLSLDIGGRTIIGKARGVQEHAIVIRPLERALEAWSRIRKRAATGAIGSVTLVGAGAAGVELALAMHHRLREDRGDHAPHIRIIGDAAPLAGIPRDARNLLLRTLRSHNIGLHTGSGVAEVGAGFVQLEGGLQFASDATFWTTGTTGPDLPRDSGLTTDEHGYLVTNEFLQSVSHPEVFGAGDCATQRGRELPRAGVFAVRAAPKLAANLRAVMTEGALERHATGARYLALISTGRKSAVGFWNGFAWDGDWAWRWKDRIDQRFVAKYR